MASTHHAIDYVEFTVRDLAAAKRFYSTAFGWPGWNFSRIPAIKSGLACARRMGIGLKSGKSLHRQAILQIQRQLLIRSDVCGSATKLRKV